MMMLAGCYGLMASKPTRDPHIASKVRAMDIAFTIVLVAVNITGFLLLAVRDTAAMGIVLDVHLGFVAALFLTLPYGKFVHSIYRSLALLRNRAEGRQEEWEA